MTQHRTADVPPFPAGSDWADPEAAFDATAAARSGRHHAVVVLWACVAAFVVVTLVLLRADTVIYDGTNSDDTGPFDGVTAFLAVVLGVGFGALPLLLAVFHSAAAVRRKNANSSRAAWRAALYTAACGVVTAVFWARGGYQTAQDRRVAAPALHDAYVLFGLTAVIGLVPLVVLLFLGVSRRTAD